MIKAQEYKEEKAKKREMDENTEYFEQVDKHGQDYFDQVEKEEKLKEQKKQDSELNYLSGIKNFNRYRDRIVEVGNKLIPKLDLPVGWSALFVGTNYRKGIHVNGKYFDTKDGLAFLLKNPKGDVHIRAVELTMIPVVDHTNLGTLLAQAENTVDSERGKLLSDKPKSPDLITPSGMIMPEI